MKPAESALRLATNSAPYMPEQLTPSHHRRQLLKSSSSSTHDDQQAAAISKWLDDATSRGPHSGGYVGSNDGLQGFRAAADAADGTLVFHDSGGSSADNSSSLAAGGAGGLTNTLILAGTSRWPSGYTVRELHMTIIVLFAVVVVASVLQLVVVWGWKLFRLNPDDLPK